jgi:hypothetical protein
MTQPSGPRAIPESLGPGVDAPDGSVTYGAAQPATVVITPRQPAEERERDRLAARERARCDRCMALPDDLVAALVRALHEAKAGRMPL